MPQTKLRKAIHDYEPDDPDDELGFDVGDIIIVLGDGDDNGWLKGKIRGTNKKGVFPKNFTVSYVDPDEEDEKEDYDEEEEEEEEEYDDDLIDMRTHYEPPGRKKSGRIEIPALNHVSMRPDSRYRPNGTMNVELPVLNHVETQSESKRPSGTMNIELPTLKRVEPPVIKTESSSTTIIEKPGLRKVEMASSTSSSPIGFIEKPTLKRVEIPSNNSSSSKAFEKPTSKPVYFVPPSTTPKSTPLSNNKATATTTTPIKPPPGLPKQSSFHLQAIPESSSIMMEPNTQNHNNKNHHHHHNDSSAKPTNATKAAPKFEKPAPIQHQGSASKLKSSNNNGNDVLTMQIPARSLTTTEPPPEQFYTPNVDTYSCTVQLTQNEKMTEKVETFQIKRQDRSQVKLTIRQNSGETMANLIAVIQEFRQLSVDELDRSAKSYGPKIVAYCQSHFGKRVGDGECWTLAKEAIKSAGCAAPVGYNFGQEVELSDARPGDILQFTNCVFEFPTGGKQYAGSPNHTAVVMGTMSEEMIPVFEQNPKPCSMGSYDFSCLKSGKVVLFRPLPPV